MWNLESGILIKIDNNICLIVNDYKYLNFSKYYAQEDTPEGESLIKDYLGDILYIYRDGCYYIKKERLEVIPEGNFNYSLISNKIHNFVIEE